MNLLLAFAPFIVFAVLARVTTPTVSLIAAATVSVLILLRDSLLRSKSPKLLEIGSALLFGSLGIYSAFEGVHWSVLQVRLYVDAGLLLVVLASMAIRRPFTLQYAQEGAPREIWVRHEFIQMNYVITAVWALAFAVMVGADLTMLYLPALSLKVGIAVTVIALLGAIRFTSRYPAYVQKSAGQSSGAASLNAKP